jgi:hypothetical protein
MASRSRTERTTQRPLAASFKPWKDGVTPPWELPRPHSIHKVQTLDSWKWATGRRLSDSPRNSRVKVSPAPLF